MKTNNLLLLKVCQWQNQPIQSVHTSTINKVHVQYFVWRAALLKTCDLESNDINRAHMYTFPNPIQTTLQKNCITSKSFTL